MEKGRATIKDVARIAGVSTATVSHVMNQTRYVSEAVQERVMAAMRETNYTSNYIAKALRSSKSHTIGVVIPDISNPFYSNIVHHMERKLHDAGIHDDSMRFPGKCETGRGDDPAAVRVSSGWHRADADQPPSGLCAVGQAIG